MDDAAGVGELEALANSLPNLDGAGEAFENPADAKLPQRKAIPAYLTKIEIDTLTGV